MHQAASSVIRFPSVCSPKAVIQERSTEGPTCVRPLGTAPGPSWDRTLPLRLRLPSLSFVTEASLPRTELPPLAPPPAPGRGNQPMGICVTSHTGWHSQELGTGLNNRISRRLDVAAPPRPMYSHAHRIPHAHDLPGDARSQGTSPFVLLRGEAPTTSHRTRCSDLQPSSAWRLPPSLTKGRLRRP